MKTQKEAVYSAVMGILESHSVEFNEGQKIDDIFTKDMKTELSEAIKAGFTSKQIVFEDTPANAAKLADDTKLSAYVSGLVNNWFRKDKRLNGGVQYIAKNPGSRTGSTDPQLKALRALLVKVEGTPAVDRVVTAIDKRLSELKPTVQINSSDIPEELQDLISDNE